MRFTEIKYPRIFFIFPLFMWSHPKSLPLLYFLSPFTCSPHFSSLVFYNLYFFSPLATKFLYSLRIHLTTLCFIYFLSPYTIESAKSPIESSRPITVIWLVPLRDLEIGASGWIWAIWKQRCWAYQLIESNTSTSLHKIAKIKLTSCHPISHTLRGSYFSPTAPPFWFWVSGRD